MVSLAGITGPNQDAIRFAIGLAAQGNAAAEVEKASQSVTCQDAE
jgi:hypothetical protein